MPRGQGRSSVYLRRAGWPCQLLLRTVCLGPSCPVSCAWRAGARSRTKRRSDGSLSCSTRRVSALRTAPAAQAVASAPTCGQSAARGRSPQRKRRPARLLPPIVWAGRWASARLLLSPEAVAQKGGGVRAARDDSGHGAELLGV